MHYYLQEFWRHLSLFGWFCVRNRLKNWIFPCTSFFHLMRVSVSIPRQDCSISPVSVMCFYVSFKVFNIWLKAFFTPKIKFHHWIMLFQHLYNLPFFSFSVEHKRIYFERIINILYFFVHTMKVNEVHSMLFWTPLTFTTQNKQPKHSSK